MRTASSTPRAQRPALQEAESRSPEPTITCPKCGTLIKLTESLAGRFRGIAGSKLLEIKGIEFESLEESDAVAILADAEEQDGSTTGR